MYRIFIAVSFVVFACLLVLPSFDKAEAQLPPEFSLPDGFGEIGERVPLNLNFQNDGQVGAINITISYDKDVVGFDFFGIDVFPGPDFVGVPSFSLSSSVTPGQIVIILDQGNGTVPPLPSGDILTINFVIDPSAIVGESTDLEISINSLTDINGQFILPPIADINDGSMTVVNEPVQNIDVTINKSADTNRIDPGVPVLVTYTITLEGVGDPGAQATQVFITDPLPSEASFREDLSSDGCEMLVGPPNSVECEVGTILRGETIQREIVVSMIGVEDVDILNQAIVDFLNEVGNPIENDSNTVTIRVRSGGGGGGGGCVISQTSHFDESGILNLSVLLILLAFVFFRARRRVNK